MFETHRYDSWLNEDEKPDGFRYSQMGANSARASISFGGRGSGFGDRKLRNQGVEARSHCEAGDVARTEVFGLGILFRVQEFVLGIPVSRGRIRCADVPNILAFR
jgi:hypothetical protein